MTKLSEFNGVMMHNPFAKRDSKKSMVTSTSKGYFHGLPCTVYKYGDTKRTTADDSTVTPQVAEFICRFFVTPVIPKIPLDIKVFRSQASRDFYDSQIKQQSTKNKLIPWLNMPEISNFVTERSGLENRLSTLERKEVPYNANDFECPPGLQRVSQPQQVVFSRKNKEDLRDLLNDIGFASEPAEAGKQSKGKAQGEK
jgi:hypothetical protein